jgi:hypothetical protein
MIVSLKPAELRLIVDAVDVSSSSPSTSGQRTIRKLDTP